MGKYILVSPEDKIIDTMDAFEGTSNGTYINDIIYPSGLELRIIECSVPDYVKNSKFKYKNQNYVAVEEALSVYEKDLRKKAKEDFALDIANDGNELATVLGELHKDGKINQAKVESLTAKMKLKPSEKDAIIKK